MNRAMLALAFLVAGPLFALAQPVGPAPSGGDGLGVTNPAPLDLFLDPNRGDMVSLNQLGNRWNGNVRVQVKDRQTGQWRTADPAIVVLILGMEPMYADPFRGDEVTLGELLFRHDVQVQVRLGSQWKEVEALWGTQLRQFVYIEADGTIRGFDDLARTYEIRVADAQVWPPVVQVRRPGTKWWKGIAVSTLYFDAQYTKTDAAVAALVPKKGKTFWGRVMSWLARLPIARKSGKGKGQAAAKDGAVQQLQRLSEAAKPPKRAK